MTSTMSLLLGCDICFWGHSTSFVRVLFLPILLKLYLHPRCSSCRVPHRHLQHNTSISHLLILLYKSAYCSQVFLSLINTIAIHQVTQATGLGIIFVFILQSISYPSLKCSVYFPDSVASHCISHNSPAQAALLLTDKSSSSNWTPFAKLGSEQSGVNQIAFCLCLSDIHNMPTFFLKVFLTHT